MAGQKMNDLFTEAFIKQQPDPFIKTNELIQPNYAMFQVQNGIDPARNFELQKLLSSSSEKDKKLKEQAIKQLANQAELESMRALSLNPVKQTRQALGFDFSMDL